MIDWIKKNIIVTVGVVVVIAAAGYFLIGGSESDEPLVVSEDLQPAESDETSDLLRLLLNLRSISLDAAIFDDPAFESLDSTVQELTDLPLGRRNPFAPLE